MYIPKLRVAVLQIPKCGSQTLREVVEAEYGKCPLAGHLTQSQVEANCRKQGKPLDRIYALIRDPWDRFISGMNFVYAKTDTSFAQAMEEYTSGRLRKSGNLVTLPQVHFLDGRMDVTLYPFERMDDLLTELGVTARVHKNKSVTRWTRHHFRKWEDVIAERLAVDDEVRERALGAS